MIHHTDCGMETFTDDVTRSLLNLASIALKAQKSSVPSHSLQPFRMHFSAKSVTSSGNPSRLDPSPCQRYSARQPAKAKSIMPNKAYVSHHLIERAHFNLAAASGQTQHETEAPGSHDCGQWTTLYACLVSLGQHPVRRLGRVRRAQRLARPRRSACAQCSSLFSDHPY